MKIILAEHLTITLVNSSPHRYLFAYVLHVHEHVPKRPVPEVPMRVHVPI